LSLGGVNTFTGNVNINNGILQLTNGDNRLPITTMNIGQSASANLGTFDLNGNNQQIAGLNSVPGTYTGASKNTVTSSTTPATLTITGSGGSFGDGSAANSGIIIGSVTVVMNGSGTQTLGDANSYTGNTIIQQGTLALGVNGVISSSPLVEVAGGATFDVSALTGGLTLIGQTLKASGTSFAGTIATGSNPGLALDATSSLLFSAFNGTTPPLTITGAGTISLNADNVVTVTVSNGGTPLGTNDYKLISEGSSGGVTGTAPSSVTINGDGIVSGATPSLVINGGELYLHVAAGAASPATNSISFGGTTATIGVLGSPSSRYVLETTTNLSGIWTPIKTNSTDINGVLNFTDSNATNQQQFYKTVQQ
jgi:fibronectin-binding autotransporter adhesin